MMQIAVLGAGSWGSALALATSNVAQVQLWSHQPKQVAWMQDYRNNPDYLPPEITFNKNISFTGDLSQLSGASLLIIATPINAVRGILQQIKQFSLELPDVFLVSKGLEAHTAKLPHQIIEDEWPSFTRYGVLIGPSFAVEVARLQPTAVTLAAPQLDFAIGWMERLSDIPNFRIYAHDDVIGSEVGAAVKNVLAIAVGISDGLFLGYNARAALITRSLNELAQLVLALGGKQETIYGLTGIGDLILTCTGDLSRNRRVGQELASGKRVIDITAALGHVAEGVSTACEIHRLALQLKIDMPIVACVYRIIYQNSDIKTEVLNLLNRAPKAEF